MPQLRRRKTMKKEEVRNIVAAVYPEVGEGKYIPKLPEISEAALTELEEMVNSVPLMRAGEITNFLEKIREERTKR